MGRIWDRRRKNKGGETLTLAVEGAQCGRQGETASNWSSVMRNAHEFVRDPWGGRLSMGMDDAFPSEGFTFFSLFGLGGLNFFIFYFLIFFFCHYYGYDFYFWNRKEFSLLGCLVNFLNDHLRT